MRLAEWISVAFFSLFLVTSVLAPLERRKRWTAVGIGLTGIAMAGSLQFFGTAQGTEVVRDLIPALFLLMAYWQSGQLFRGGDPKLQALLEESEKRWFPAVGRISSSLESRPILSAYLELAYLMCYPVVPLGIAVLYLADMRHAIDPFWTVVLPPSFACYASIALLQSLPPRHIERKDSGRARGSPSRLRSVNLWVLQRASVRANTLPSGHVANSLAIALVLMKLVPAAGAIFLWIAGSIAIATAILRYHYSIDAVLGIALAFLSFVLLG